MSVLALTASLTGVTALAVIGTILTLGAPLLTTLLTARLTAGACLTLAAGALAVLALTTRLAGINALAVAGTILTLGAPLLTTLLTARLTAGAITLAARLGALRTAGRRIAGREGKPTAR